MLKCQSGAVITLQIILLVQMASSALAQVNQQAIDDVAAGKVKVAKASWWGFDPVESTPALQAAIDSGAEKVIVENLGKPWIVDKMRLASDQELFFEEGVEVLAKQGAFKGTGDSLFSANLQENITLNGYGATLRMRRADYDGPEYEKAEWRMVLAFRSCSNVKVYGLTLTESGGDGIYLGTAKAGVTNKDVHIKDVICDKNYRQGISVINAENLLIEDTILRDTAGTAPQAGIDFEPNSPGERLVNCVMRNCVSEGNAGDGYDIYIPPLTAESEPISMRFENCRSIGNNTGTRIVTGNTPDRAVRGTIDFTNCVFEGSRSAGVSIVGKPVNGCRISFENCAVLDAAAEAPNAAPIVLMSRQGNSEAIGGVDLGTFRVRDAVDRRPMTYIDMAGGVGLQGITGKLVVEKAGAQEEVVITDKLLAEWMPFAALKAIPRTSLAALALKPLVAEADAAAYSLEFVRLRRVGRLLLYATAGDEVSFRVRYMQVAKYSGRPIPVIIVAPSGTEVKRVEAAFKEETPVSFEAPETGVYRVTVDPGGNYAQIIGNSHPMTLNGEDTPVGLYSSPGELFFWVPAGTKEFGVRVYGEGLGEAVKATLLNPAGEVVEEADNVTRTHQFEVTLPEPSPGEAWCLCLARASEIMMEDHHVDLRGIPPLLAPSREALLVPAQ